MSHDADQLAADLFRWKRAHAGMVRFMTKDHEQCLRTQLALRHSELIRGEQESEIARLRDALQKIAAEGCEACLMDYAWEPGTCPACRAGKALK